MTNLSSLTLLHHVVPKECYFVSVKHKISIARRNKQFIPYIACWILTGGWVNNDRIGVSYSFRVGEHWAALQWLKHFCEPLNNKSNKVGLHD